MLKIIEKGELKGLKGNQLGAYLYAKMLEEIERNPYFYRSLQHYLVKHYNELEKSKMAFLGFDDLLVAWVRLQRRALAVAARAMTYLPLLGSIAEAIISMAETVDETGEKSSEALKQSRNNSSKQHVIKIEPHRYRRVQDVIHLLFLYGNLSVNSHHMKLTRTPNFSTKLTQNFQFLLNNLLYSDITPISLQALSISLLILPLQLSTGARTGLVRGFLGLLLGLGLFLPVLGLIMLGVLLVLGIILVIGLVIVILVFWVCWIGLATSRCLSSSSLVVMRCLSRSISRGVMVLLRLSSGSIQAMSMLGAVTGGEFWREGF